MTSGAERLLLLLNVESRILKAATVMEVAFIAVNDAHTLVPYRQAVLWSQSRGVEAVSGLAVPEPNAPFLLWIEEVFCHFIRNEIPARITGMDLPDKLAGQWVEWLPPYSLWVPLEEGAGLLYAGDEPWRSPDDTLLIRLAEAVTASRARFYRPPFLRGWLARIKGRRRSLALVAGVALVLLFPVTGSVLAPADSVSAHPIVVRAPLDGVVDRIHVKPNELVTEGQSLFDLDATMLVGRLEVARQQHAIAEAEYRQVAQAQVFDPKAKVQVAILAGKSEEKAAEARLLESQLARTSVKAPKDGIAVFDDPSDWIGKPVAVGEKVMVLADEADTEVEAWVTASDIGEVKSGARLTLFLNTAPLSPSKAIIRSVAYEAAARPDATIAHRVRATLVDGESMPRLGLKGTARIDGERVPLIWWLFRRPLATIRQFVGF
jgi:hypothetical protein